MKEGLARQLNAGSSGSWTGFPAAAVNVGELRAAIERGIARMNMTQLETRWTEVFAWLCAATRSWVQRPKRMSFERQPDGIAVTLQTQDALGYYEYRLDVLPGRP